MARSIQRGSKSLPCQQSAASRSFRRIPVLNGAAVEFSRLLCGAITWAIESTGDDSALENPLLRLIFTSNREWQIAETWRCRSYALGVWPLSMYVLNFADCTSHFAPLILANAFTVTANPFEVKAQAYPDLVSEILSICDGSTTHAMETSDPRLPKEPILATPQPANPPPPPSHPVPRICGRLRCC